MSWSKKKRKAVLEGSEVVCSKRDNDNIEKGVWDGLVEAGAIEDDRFIIHNETHRLYGEEDTISIVISPYVRKLPTKA